MPKCNGPAGTAIPDRASIHLTSNNADSATSATFPQHLVTNHLGRRYGLRPLIALVIAAEAGLGDAA